MCVHALNQQKPIFAQNEANNSLPPNLTRSATKLIFVSRNRFSLKGKENKENLKFVPS